MKFELKIGKASKEFIKGDRKEITSVEDIIFTADIQPNELPEVIKLIAEAVKDACVKETPVYEEVVANKPVSKTNDVVSEILASLQEEAPKSKNDLEIINIYVKPMDRSMKRFEFIIVMGSVEYRLFTIHKSVVIDATLGKLNKEDIQKVVEDAKAFRTSLSGVRKLNGDDIAYVLNLINCYHSQITVIEK